MAANEAMQQQNQVLETLSITDSLTGLYNRSKLDAILTDELARFKRTQRAFTLLMMDIDHFKTLNDTYGHITGDEILASRRPNTSSVCPQYRLCGALRG